jgi:phage shock protein A
MESMPSINTNQNYSVCDKGKPKVIKPLTADEEAIKNLEQELNDRQEDGLQVRQALAQSMAALKRQERKYAESASQAEEAATFKAGLDKQSKQVELLKKNLVEIEAKIIEAKNNRKIFKARLQSAQT